MKYLPIDKQLFIENRKRFATHLKAGMAAIFNANDEMPRNGDGTFAFRQNSDLFYLSGIDQELTVLVICPDCPLPQYREVLFLRQTNEKIAVWEGHKYTKEEARAASGIQSVYWLEEMDAIVNVILNHSTGIYININENDRFASEVPYRELRFAATIQKKYPAHQIERSGPIMAKLRSIKSDTEIKLMQVAMDITDKAFRRVLAFTKPGVTEYEIEAEIIHEFIRNRATGHAYNPIIASGKNANVLHYNDNNQVCLDGDVILMDFGAEYANYAADLTRCIPVNGKFTARQKDVYNAVLRVMTTAVGGAPAPHVLVPAPWPNPFNPAVSFRFELRDAAPVRLSVVDARGRLVRRLLDGGTQPAGPAEQVWDGRDDAGRPASSGVYTFVLEAAGLHYRRGVTLVR